MNSIRRANDTLLQLNCQKIFLTLAEMREAARSLGYSIFSYSEGERLIEDLGVAPYKNFEGFTVFIDNEYIIFYKDELSYPEKMFVIAHEIGHIVLEHTYCGVMGKAADEAMENEQEKEADIFAYQFIAPVCVLKRYGVKTVQDIENLTVLTGWRAEHVLELCAAKGRQPGEEALLRLFFPRRKRMVWLSALAVFLIAASTLCLLALSGSGSGGPPDENMLALGENAAAEEPGICYWLPNGTVYHLFPDCQYIAGNDNVISGTASEARDEGKMRVCMACKGRL